MDHQAGRQNSVHYWSWTKKAKRIKRNEYSLRDIWDNIKYTNICIIGVPEGEEKEAEGILKDIIAENFHNLGKETDIQAPISQRPK